MSPRRRAARRDRRRPQRPEWRLDPTSARRLPVAVSSDVRYIIVCNEGYSSSLAAATLRELGLRRATDLVGGFQAWVNLRRSPES